MTSRTSTIWTFAITSVALFMTTLDNLALASFLIPRRQPVPEAEPVGRLEAA